MPTTTAIAGMCHICQQTVAGHRIRRHLSRCIPARVGLTMVQDPLNHISQRVCDNWVFTTIRTFPYSEGRDSVRSDSGITA